MEHACKGQWTFNGSNRLKHSNRCWMLRGWELEVSASGADLTVISVVKQPPQFFKPSALPIDDEICGGFQIVSVGEAAFLFCNNISSVAVPRGVTSIGEGAFHNCRELADVTIPESVIEIDCWAFCGCDKLTNVVIPSSVAKIGAQAFALCGNLQRISVSENNRDYCSVDGVVFSKDKTRIVAFPAGRSGAYEIPGGVTSVDDGAFCGCVNLTSVIVPDSVVSIGESAFEDCNSLANVRIGCRVSSIGERAFDTCSSLSAVELPDSVVSIGNWAFEDCSSLASVRIGRGVTSIEPRAFSCCGSNATIFVSPENPVYHAIDGKQLRCKKNGAQLFPCPEEK